ncbi:hypothetical protein HY490_03995, partial [Candidatus Woesearchaeota archaeon]|nr:hypothetical protein [Candidatus Woesearchaeota archaeon]
MKDLRKAVPTSDAHFYFREPPYKINSSKEIRRHLQELTDFGYVIREDVLTNGGKLDSYAWKLKFRNSEEFVKLVNLLFEYNHLKAFMETQAFKIASAVHLPRLLGKCLNLPVQLLPTFTQYMTIQKLALASPTAFHALVNKNKVWDEIKLVERFVKFELDDKRNYASFDDQILQELPEQFKKYFFKTLPIKKDLESVQAHVQMLDVLIAYFLEGLISDILHGTVPQNIEELSEILKHYKFELRFTGNEPFTVNDITSAIKILHHTLEN